jgi:hypothetical protein
MNGREGKPIHAATMNDKYGGLLVRGAWFTSNLFRVNIPSVENRADCSRVAHRGEAYRQMIARSCELSRLQARYEQITNFESKQNLNQIMETSRCYLWKMADVHDIMN